MKNHIDDNYLMEGDIVFTQSPTFLGKLIRMFTRESGESKTEANHCGIVTNAGSFRSGDFPSAMIVEALHKVEHHSLRKSYADTDVQLSIYRPINLSYSEKWKVMVQAESYIGKTYGYGKIILHFLDWVIGNRQFFRRLVVLERYPICSYLVAKSYSIIGKDFGVKAKIASPDDILDFCQQNPKKYRKIWGWGVI